MSSIAHRCIQWIEGVNRKFIYRFVLGNIFHNPPLVSKLDACDVRAVLVLRTDYVGDMICTTPAFRVLKNLNPHLRILVACSDANHEIIRYDPDVEAVVLMKHGKVDRAALRYLQSQDIDILFNPVKLNMTKNGLLLNRISRRGIKAAIGHSEREQYKILYNYLHPITGRETELHVSQSYIELIKGVFANVVREEWIEQYIIIPERERKRWMDFAASHAIEKKKYVVVNLSARQAHNRWSREGYRKFLQESVRRFPALRFVLAAVGDDDIAFARELEGSARERVHFFSTLSVLTAAAMCEDARVVLTPDTGFLHIASAMKSAIVALISEKEFHWKPFNVPSKIVSTPGYDVGGIDALEVVKAVEEMIAL